MAEALPKIKIFFAGLLTGTHRYVLVASLVLLYICRSTGLDSILNDSIALPLAFKCREMLGKEPTLDPRLKILAYDDKTTGRWKVPDLEIKDWAFVFNAIASANPRAIVIDKMFGLPLGREGIATFKSGLQTVATPIFAAVVAVMNEIEGRPTLNALTRPEFRQDQYLRGERTIEVHKSPSWLHTVLPFAYGPDPEIADAFMKLGHSLNGGGGYIQPFVRVSSLSVLPHIGLLAATTLRLESHGISVDGATVGVNAKGQMLANLVPPNAFHQRTKTLVQTIEPASRNQVVPGIRSEDVVLILPSMYFGNVDWLDTPAGRMQRGYVTAALLNSVLTGKWLTLADDFGVAAIFASILAIFAGTLCNTATFAAVAIAGNLAIIGVSIWLFTGFGIVYSWVLPVVGWTSTGFIAFAIKNRRVEQETRRLVQGLQGIVAPIVLKEIMANPHLRRREPTEEVVTVMFVDIVNFSLTAEQQSPKDCFRHLKAITALVTQTVHDFDGIVDRTVGDGLLCYFGYRFDKETPARRAHADGALECAVKLQTLILERNLQDELLGYALRVGINTAAVFLGDLGDASRVDFTIIGSGVNLAQRLEAACDPYRIMLGPTTKELLTSANLNTDRLKRRLVSIKHKEQPFEAYEFDPFTDRLKEVELALAKMAKLTQLERRAPRFIIPDDVQLTLDTPFGRLTVLDFSASGIKGRLGVYLGKGMTITLACAAPDAPRSVVCEVRWGRQGPDGFVHGLMLKDVSGDQKQAFFDALRTALARQQMKQIKNSA